MPYSVQYHCHGGPVGFNKRIWTVEVINEEEPEIALHLFSPDGDQDFPGNLTVTVTYKLTNENSWYIRYVATTDSPTIINLTQHAYFNLKGYAGGTIRDTELMIDADSYLVTDCNLLPTGEIKMVEGTPFDFRTPKAIGRDLDEKNDDLFQYLCSENICVRNGLHCAPVAHRSGHTEEYGTIRISFSVFNTEAEVDHLSKILKKYIKSL